MAPPDELAARPPSSQVTWKTAFTVCAAVLFVAGLVYFVSRTLLSVALTLASAMIAVALDHAVQYLVHRGVRRWLAIAVVFFAVMGLLIAFFFIIVPRGVSQGEKLAQQAPQLWANFQKSGLFQQLNERVHLQERIQGLENDAAKVAQNAVEPLLSVISGVLNVVAGLVTVLFLSLFMLIFGGPLLKSALTEAIPERADRYLKVLNKIYHSVGGYLGGVLLICSINFSLTTIWLAFVARVPFSLPLGILSGASSTIPYVGSAVTGAAITLIVLATKGFWWAVGTAGYFVFYGQLEGNVFGPIIFRRTVHINPLLSLLSILFLAEFAGVFGAILAVPLVAGSQIILREILASRREGT